MANERVYGNGSNSSIGASQFNDFYYKKKALIEMRKEQYFGQLADVTNMPKHMGKKIKMYHYLPLLHDANINDQGIDANGATTDRKVTIVVTKSDGSIPSIPNTFATASVATQAAYFVGEGATAVAAEDDAVKKVVEWASTVAAAGGLALNLTQATSYDADFATLVTTGGESAYDLGFRFTQPDGTTITAAAGALEAQSVPDTGNLYGSSKDIGTITAKLPALSEVGGRVNRVGFKRVELEGTIEKFGFFDEYTKESLDFDSDAELAMHINREMLNGANEMTEAALQIDLINGAGVVKYGGTATSNATITGEGTASVVTYEDLMKLSIDLDNNRCPKHTSLITGTRMVDTKTVNAARYMYIGSELIPTVKKMKGIDASSADGSGFVSVEKYASAGNIARGEIGQVDQFKIIVVPEMLHWAGGGDLVGTNPGYRSNVAPSDHPDHAGETCYDVYPMLVVGDKSFTTIGFQTDGKTVKFNIKHSKPESQTSYSKDDPYGEMGFMSIKWYYGTMILRPERIALVKTVAEY